MQTVERFIVKDNAAYPTDFTDIERLEKYRDMLDILWMLAPAQNNRRKILFGESQLITSKINKLKRMYEKTGDQVGDQNSNEKLLREGFVYDGIYGSTGINESY